MKLILDRNSRIGLMQQLYNTLENLIISEIMVADSALPSIRALAEECDVSPMTVVKAYKLLEKKNLIYQIQGKGSFVKKRNTKNQYKNLESDHEQSPPADWKRNIQDYVVRAGFSQRAINYAANSINLGIATLHERFLPTKYILDSFYKNYDINLLVKHSPVAGDIRLLNTAKLYLEDKGIEASTESMIITSGSQSGINLVAQTFIGQGDVVVIEAPSFPGAIDVFKSRGALVLEVPVTVGGIDVDYLLMLCEKYPVKLLYTMPTFHNPTGFTAKLERLQALLELAREHQFLILEDDPWSDLFYHRLERPLKSLDKEGRVIYLAGLSKTLGPTFKLSAIVADSIFRQKLINAKSIIDSSSPLLSQHMISSYLGSMEHKQHLIKTRYELRELLNRVRQHIEGIRPSYVHVKYPEGGLVIWFTLPAYFDCKLLFYKLMTDEGIIILLGEHCYSSVNGLNQFRICFSSETEEKVLSSITRIFSLIIELNECMKEGAHTPLS